MTAPSVMCTNPDVHTSHFWRMENAHIMGKMMLCAGVDPEPLPDERDRPTNDLIPLEPEYLWLTDAAAIVVRAYQNGPNGGPSSAYYGAVAVWQELCGMSEPEALTYAFSIATLVGDKTVMGTVIPL